MKGLTYYFLALCLLVVLILWAVKPVQPTPPQSNQVIISDSGMMERAFEKPEKINWIVNHSEIK